MGCLSKGRAPCLGGIKWWLLQQCNDLRLNFCFLVVKVVASRGAGEGKQHPATQTLRARACVCVLLHVSCLCVACVAVWSRVALQFALQDLKTALIAMLQVYTHCLYGTVCLCVSVCVCVCVCVRANAHGLRPMAEIALGY